VDIDDLEYATADDLTTGDIDTGEEDFLIEAIGKKVRIRPLSRSQAFTGNQLREKRGAEVADKHMVQCAVVRPVMSPDEVDRLFRRTRAGTLEPLTRRIAVISRMGGEEQDRRVADEFRGEPGTGVGIPPGGSAAADDSGASGDVQP
jgi:hypothetical protein